MAKNPPCGDGHRHGPVKDRSQTHNPRTDKWVKRDTETGRFIDQKSDQDPFKGVRKEKQYLQEKTFRRIKNGEMYKNKGS